jgi:Asp-tRNA(Asn)/Glu-tRNA(Gln) amidotransferase A subunit family amidase
MPLTPSLERIGPICRRVEDAALILAVINGVDPTSAASIDMGFSYDANIDIRALKVGYSPSWFEEVGFALGTSSKPRAAGATPSPYSVAASAAHHQALDALRALGVQLVPLDLPSLQYSVLLHIVYVEAAAVFQDLTLTHGDEGLLPSNPWRNGWSQAHMLSAVDYLQIERFRRHVMNEMAVVFSRVDAVFGPTYGSFDLFLAMNLTGQPGVSLRAGFAQSPTRTLAPAPIDPKGPTHTITQNVAFHGRLFEDGKILALARALEAKLDVWRQRPPVD